MEFGAQVNQDFVEYHIFAGVGGIDLDVLREELQNFCAEYLRHYIWQRDHFSLQRWNPERCQRSKKNHFLEAPPHLYNRQYFGECVEDEWFVVYILQQISKFFHSKYQLIITIQDNDGEFLLIEAAYQLPKWISKPKHAINRIFIYNGDLHILPRCFAVDDPSSFGISNAQFYNDAKTFPPINESLSYIQHHSHSTKADQSIQTAAFSRIDKYTSLLTKYRAKEIDCLQEQHFACVFVPRCIGNLLNTTNTLSLAITSLYELEFNPQLLQVDPKYKKIQKLCNLHPNVPQVKIWIRVRFSRWLYAQLNCFRIPFDKMTPQEEAQMKSKYSAQEMKAILLGRKLEFAYSLLYHNCTVKANDERIQGIRKYFDAVTTLKAPVEDVITSRDLLPQDSDESWMKVSPQEVDDILQQQQERVDKNGSDSFTMGDMMKNMDEFMEQESGFEGIGDDSSGTDDEFYSGSEDYEDDEEMIAVMEQMQLELKQAGVFSTSDNSENDNLNFMKQFIASVEEQPGLPNPISNLLQMINKNN